jgi:uncharacterized protein YndB with AHSA1/START domain
MADKMVVISSVDINAPSAKVWDTLTNPEQTQKYMFGCQTVSDWKPGSPLLWKGNYEGKDMIFVKGVILDIKPFEMLQYTVIDPNSPMKDIPENYLRVIYQLKQDGQKTVLTVTQDGFEDAEDGERRYKETYNNGEGWNPILIQIKKLAEEL